MKWFFTCLFSVTFFFITQAQDPEIALRNFFDKASVVNEKEDIDKGIKGSRYLNKEFKAGSVITNTGTKHENLLLRYNIYDKILEVRHDNRLVRLSIESYVREMTIGDQKLVCLTNSSKTDFLGVFEEVYIGTKHKLYEKLSVQFTPSRAGTGMLPDVPAEFKNDSGNFMIYNGDEQFYITSKKELKKLVAGQKWNSKSFPKKWNSQEVAIYLSSLDKGN